VEDAIEFDSRPLQCLGITIGPGYEISGEGLKH
jgi:hypothetical protein